MAVDTPSSTPENPRTAEKSPTTPERVRQEAKDTYARPDSSDGKPGQRDLGRTGDGSNVQAGADEARPSFFEGVRQVNVRRDAADQLRRMETDGRQVLGGDPIPRVDHWRFQGVNDLGLGGTCGVVSVGGLVADFGTHITETELVSQADELKLLGPGGGTSAEDRQALLRENGIESVILREQSLESLAKITEDGHGVIARVSAAELRGSDLIDDYTETADGRLAPDHAVVVTGTVRSDTGELNGFVVNDSGNPNGAGVHVSKDLMRRAWQDLGADPGSLNVTATPRPGWER
ncbi:MAG: hypothetical protein AAGD35_23005 [Actinomycetota bacterium]